jgi:hypothetical protein
MISAHNNFPALRVVVKWWRRNIAPICSIALPDCQAQCFHCLSARTMVPLRSGLLVSSSARTKILRSGFLHFFVWSYPTAGPWYSDSCVGTPVMSSPHRGCPPVGSFPCCMIAHSNVVLTSGYSPSSVVVVGPTDRLPWSLAS